MAKRLLLSIEEFNVERIPLFIVCPKDDFELFEVLAPELNAELVAEESFDEPVFSASEIMSSDSGVGFMNQQIYKMAFAELNLAEHYLCLDSDAVFVRPFYMKDFIHEKTGVPYLFQTEDRELRADWSYRDTWQSRDLWLRAIDKVMKAETGEPPLAIHGFQVFTRSEILAMMQWLLENSGIRSFKEMLTVAPYESNWYTTWVRTHSTKFISREPIFRTFHGSRDLARSLYFNLGESDYARGYVGVCVNGNFQHGRGVRAPLSLETSPAILAGVYLPVNETVRLALNAFGALGLSLMLLVPRLIRRALIRMFVRP